MTVRSFKPSSVATQPHSRVLRQFPARFVRRRRLSGRTFFGGVSDNSWLSSATYRQHFRRLSGNVFDHRRFSGNVFGIGGFPATSSAIGGSPAISSFISDFFRQRPSFIGSDRPQILSSLFISGGYGRTYDSSSDFRTSCITDNRSCNSSAAVRSFKLSSVALSRALAFSDWHRGHFYNYDIVGGRNNSDGVIGRTLSDWWRLDSRDRQIQDSFPASSAFIGGSLPQNTPLPSISSFHQSINIQTFIRRVL